MTSWAIPLKQLFPNTSRYEYVGECFLIISLEIVHELESQFVSIFRPHGSLFLLRYIFHSETCCACRRYRCCAARFAQTAISTVQHWILAFRTGPSDTDGCFRTRHSTARNRLAETASSTRKHITQPKQRRSKVPEFWCKAAAFGFENSRRLQI